MFGSDAESNDLKSDTESPLKINRDVQDKQDVTD